MSAALRAAAQDFVDKVDSGRARSVDSYNKFKAALATPDLAGAVVEAAKDIIGNGGCIGRVGILEPEIVEVTALKWFALRDAIRALDAHGKPEGEG